MKNRANKPAMPQERMWWEKPTERTERYERILECLREDARMSLVEISRRTKMPTSTVYDCVKQLEGRFWFTSVFLDEKAQRIREQVRATPTARHKEILEVLL